MKKLLIVEDDDFLVDAYRTKLQREALTVDIARDGVEAIEKIKDFEPDLIILDILMPRKDGYEVLKKMKEEGRQIPVIVASNLNLKGDIDRALELGAKDFFIKSDISISDLIAKCKKYLQ